MNIFVLDYDITTAAQNHCDAHCSKMILESAQILSTVLRSNNIQCSYKSFNPKHPCCIWAGTSFSNFEWLRSLGLSLGVEFKYRYCNEHKSVSILETLPRLPIDDTGLTPFVQAMPIECKCSDTVLAYRTFYRNDKYKKGILKYTNREPPKWLSMRFNVGLRGDNKIVYSAVGVEKTENVYDWKLA